MLSGRTVLAVPTRYWLGTLPLQLALLRFLNLKAYFPLFCCITYYIVHTHKYGENPFDMDHFVKFLKHKQIVSVNQRSYYVKWVVDLFNHRVVAAAAFADHSENHLSGATDLYLPEGLACVQTSYGNHIVFDVARIECYLPNLRWRPVMRY